MSQSSQEPFFDCDCPDISISENRLFGILVLLGQVGLCVAYGYKMKYTSDDMTELDHFLIAMLCLLLVGFGLMSVYIKRASVASLAHVFLITAVTFELFFIVGGVFERIGVPYKDWKTQSSGQKFAQISLINYNNDRRITQTLFESSYVDCLACCISLVIAYGALIGRVSNLQTLIFAIGGVFAYQFQNHLFWRFYIIDIGYSMKVFGFGSAYGLVFSLFMGRYTEDDENNETPDYSSTYLFQIFSFIGAIIAWCLLPALSLASLLHGPHGSMSDYKILQSSVIKVWMSLMASCIGSICASLMVHKKLSIHDITFSLISGGIIFGSSLHKAHYTLSIAISIGFVCSFISCLGAIYLKRWMNKYTVIDSNGITSLFLFPSFFAAVTSLQMLGAGLSIGIGAGAGVSLGLIMCFLRPCWDRKDFTSIECIGVDEEKKTN